MMTPTQQVVGDADDELSSSIANAGSGRGEVAVPMASAPADPLSVSETAVSGLPHSPTIVAGPGPVLEAANNTPNEVGTLGAATAPNGTRDARETSDAESFLVFAHRAHSPPSAPPIEGFDSAELRAMKTRKWKNGRELTAYIQDMALKEGKRALVATSGGSFKKFVCSSETPCPWLINAVCTRPRQRKKRASDNDPLETRGIPDAQQQSGKLANATAVQIDETLASRKYWYVSSGYLVHANCTGMAKPTARQLRNSAVLKRAIVKDSKVSSAVLVEQLKSQARLLCTKSMVYKAKIDLLDALDGDTSGQTNEGVGYAGGPEKATSISGVNSETLQATQLLPGYLVQLSNLNPDLLHSIERDPTSTAHFWRAFLALDPHRFTSSSLAAVIGIDVALPTATAGPRGSAEIICLARDSNHNLVTLAAALVPEPSELHLTWFLQKLLECGYALQANIVFTNGRWPIGAACTRVGIPFMLQDTRYLIQDLELFLQHQVTAYRQRMQPSLLTSSSLLGESLLRQDQVSLIWNAQSAESEGEFYAILQQLEGSDGLGGGQLPNGNTIGGIAAQQLRGIDPRRWALFPHFTTTRLYGWRGTRFIAAEHGRSVGVSPAQETHCPCEFFKMIGLILMNEAYQRHELASQWEREQRTVTPEAERMMQEEMKLVPTLNVAMSSPHVAFVWNPQNGGPIKQQRVDLQEKSCTCGVRMQYGIPCRHILAVLRKLNGLGQSFEFFDKCYLTRNYTAAFKNRSIELPPEGTVVPDSSWLPARHTLEVREILSHSGSTGVSNNSHERCPVPKKRRMRNKPHDQRKRGVYKCRRCGVADGHNSMTCTNPRQSSLGAAPPPPANGSIG